MSALYEIQEDILSCIDLKTGEIIDVERLHGLQMERRKKIRNIACWIKNLLADARAYEEEEKTFAARKTAAKNKADSLKQYLSDCLHGEKIQDKEFSIGWRKSHQVQIDEGAAIPEAYLILGHSSIAITADLYTHVMQKTKEEAAGKIGDYVFGTQEK